ncbi:helix-turn-helix domain-containing protein [Labrys okinawensis]|uniref:helix-turn-helix domain-containing protein n=1 Tax=Labrys okinawensis TaxID=346911 RepID=UPI0039BD15EC
MQETDPRIGGKIQRLRRQGRISQAQLAGSLGISASYLNLIEHNRRRMTVPLLLKTASYFGVDAGELAENDDSRLAGDLMELFGDDLFADSEVTNQDVRDLATSNPQIGRAIVHLFDRFRALRGAGTGVTSAAEAGYHVATDAVSDFLQLNSNHFPSLEAQAERIRAEIDQLSDSFEQGLKLYLFNVFGLQWRPGALPLGLAGRLSKDHEIFETADVLPPETAIFAASHRLGLLATAREIDWLIEVGSLPADAPALARHALAAYFAGALIMPYEPFLRACKETRYDIDRIARRFNSSFEQVCHRMTTLQRPGLSGIPLHLIRTDIAGNISKRFSLSGIHIPRHSGACPRWNVYAAFLHPGQINVQVSQMPEGQRYFCIAKSLTKGGHRHNAPRRYLSIGLGCHISHAQDMVYSDGIDVSNPAQAVPIGVGCRICPRLDCGQRAHPPAEHRLQLNEDEQAESLYSRI